MIWFYKTTARFVSKFNTTERKKERKNMICLNVIYNESVSYLLFIKYPAAQNYNLPAPDPVHAISEMESDSAYI